VINQLLKIASEEWRYWFRTKLAISVLFLMVCMTTAAVVITAFNVALQTEQREALQRASEKAFIEQPDRHPHRMIHYGHYLFRTPPPLSAIDPGVDSYTGTSIFLEGHRQNGSTFSGQQQSTGLSWLGAFSPANVLQVFAPLLLIIVGYSVVSREKEAGTFTFLKVQGVNPLMLILGKGCAILSAAGLVMLPLIAGSLFALSKGESGIVTFTFVISYVIYLCCWSAVVLFASVVSKSNRGSFILLICLWVATTVLLPRIASNSATVLVNSPGKIETDFSVLQKLREQGDGHNANDPAFSQLKANLLAKYNVDKVEDLPINYKGIVAQSSEKNLSKILNDYAIESMTQQVEQAQVARSFGWLSPSIAIKSVSMQLAGTDLENYHRFLVEAENVRYKFVQSLNELHAHEVSYNDDNNKYKNEDTREKAKVSSDNWKVLDNFNFSIAPSEERLTEVKTAIMQLVFVFFIFIALTVFSGRRL